MSFVATAIIGAGVIGGGAAIYSANKAASTQTALGNQAIAAEQNQFSTARGEAQPFIDSGQSVLPTLNKLLTPGADQTATLSQLPGFQFASDWGQRGVSNQGTVTGLGGNTIAAGAQFGTGLAQTNWNQFIAQLQGQAQLGASSAGTLGGQAIQTGGQIGSNLVGVGNAQAGATMATGAAIGNIGNSITTAALLNKLTGNQSMYGTQPFGPTGRESISPSGNVSGF